MTDPTSRMMRAIALARQAEGRTAPNPLVGCVIVKDGEIVGEGFHEGPGRPHAEPMALEAAGRAARGATAIVSLEPCNHHGRTPPCTDALIAAGVSDVIYGAQDPNPLAAGGQARLREAGIRARQIEEGPGRSAAEDLIRPWRTALGRDVPYVTAKLAMTLDGRTATRTGESKWITGEGARARGHDLRQRSDAIIVGVGTVLADDPALDPRPQGRAPVPSLKGVLDTTLRTPTSARLLSTPGHSLIFCGADQADSEKADALRASGAEVVGISLDDRGRVDLRTALRVLKDRGTVTEVMIEGGGTLLGAAFEAGLVDEVWAFMAPVVLGGGRPAIAGEGPASLIDAHRLQDVTTEYLAPDLLIRGRIERST